MSVLESLVRWPRVSNGSASDVILMMINSCVYFNFFGFFLLNYPLLRCLQRSCSSAFAQALASTVGR